MLNKNKVEVNLLIAVGLVKNSIYPTLFVNSLRSSDNPLTLSLTKVILVVLRYKVHIVLLVFLIFSSCRELSVDRVLATHNDKTVPYISIEEYADDQVGILVDSREWEEYEVSHLKGAVWVGYEDFRLDRVASISSKKDTTIIVYCSVGVRSEDVGEKLLQAGYTDVKNLYGGIFEWKNRGLVVVDSTGNSTENVHAYSKYWGRLLTDANKVY